MNSITHLQGYPETAVARRNKFACQIISTNKDTAAGRPPAAEIIKSSHLVIGTSTFDNLCQDSSDFLHGLASFTQLACIALKRDFCLCCSTEVNDIGLDPKDKNYVPVFKVWLPIAPAPLLKGSDTLTSEKKAKMVTDFGEEFQAKFEKLIDQDRLSDPSPTYYAGLDIFDGVPTHEPRTIPVQASLQLFVFIVFISCLVNF